MSIAAPTAQSQNPSPIMIGACLDELTHASTDRPGVPVDDRAAHADATRCLILSFPPRDGIQLLFASQAVLFRTLGIDARSDVRGRMPETFKPRGRSGVIPMGRIVAERVDSLIRLQGRPNREATTADAPEQGLDSPAAADDEPKTANEPSEPLATRAPALPTPHPRPASFKAARKR